MRLIDADALKRDICKYCNDVYSDEPCEPSDCEHMRIIDNQPTIDAVEVVRCKDCRHTKTDGMADPAIYCQKYDIWEIHPDHFCAFGERKDE